MACVAMTLGVGDPAAAASTRVRFRIPPQPYPEALLDLAQQANVTLIGAAACQGVSRSVVAGSMTVEEALSRLLAGAPCEWRMVAAGAIEISRARQVEAPRLPAGPPTTVGELLVTATKRVRDPRELAVGITAIPRRRLNETGASDPGDAAAQMAGVLTTNLGPGRNKLLLRGLSDGVFTGRARSTVATFLDDIPVNYNAPDPDLRLVDVERVEVARGPQGALYGAGAMSGVYRIVTRKPDLDQWSAEARVTGASTEGGGPSGALEGYINVPIWGETAGLRLSAYHEVQGGYLDDIVQNRSNVDRTERQGGRLTLLVQPREALSITLTGAAQSLRSEDTHYTIRGIGRKRAVLIPEPHVNDIELATATVRRSWSGVELTSATGFVRHTYGSLFDATPVQANYTDQAQTSAYSERTRTRMWVQDVFLTSRGVSKLEWLVGLYASEARLRSPSELLAQNPGRPNVSVYSEQRHETIRELAGYGELSYEPAPGWTLALGGRFYDIDRRIRSDVVSERFAPRSLDRSNQFTGFSPKISLQRQFENGDLLYAVVSEGFRPGGVNTGGAQPAPVARETFSSDRLRNYEVGVKLERWQRRLSLSSAIYYDVWRDLQTDQFLESGIPYTTNAGDARVLGVEAEVAFRTDNGFLAQLNGRVSRTRTTNANLEFIPVLANNLPGAPPISGGALVAYERPVFGDWTARIVGQAIYVGLSRVSFDALLPRTGGFTQTRLLGEISRDGRGAQVFVTNALDSFRDTFSFGNPFTAPQARQITPQRPITVGATLFASF
ncbi:TonB-dependent receptor domain-containing protein [Phenylobacterium sp.]|uniref:TonB-dependent receptor domain-containing protein n=1 Tax=Phenylobacterium sp. TaxID=1871053 RepID=UPI0028125100|nr:TonB-dependent receptor [Phenylobacterium sp.]